MVLNEVASVGQPAQVEARGDYDPQDVPVPPGAGPLALQHHFVVEAVGHSIGLDARLAHLVVHTHRQSWSPQLHTLLHQDTIADLSAHTHTHTHTHTLSNILSCDIKLMSSPPPYPPHPHLVPRPLPTSSPDRAFLLRMSSNISRACLSTPDLFQ